MGQKPFILWPSNLSQIFTVYHVHVAQDKHRSLLPKTFVSHKNRPVRIAIASFPKNGDFSPSAFYFFTPTRKTQPISLSYGQSIKSEK